MSKIFFVLWPSFVVAGIAEAVFFTFFSPQDLFLFGHPLTLSAIATYSIGFFCFWIMCGLSSYATCFFQRSAKSINDETIAHTTPTA
ncbi:MAG TPA: hypothetical protein VMC81_06890 [Rhodocyclaceae bacterium]|nr:hypothetical protein [Rhodocyclaceae bacterium]